MQNADNQRIRTHLRWQGNGGGTVLPPERLPRGVSSVHPAKTKIPVKQGASLKIAVTAGGSGWLQGGCHFYKDQNSYTGSIHAPRSKVRPGMKTYTFVIDLNDAKAANADFLRLTVFVLPGSEIDIQSVKAEIAEP